MNLAALFVVLALLFVGSAFFSMSEVAFVRISRLRLRYLLQQKVKQAPLVHRIMVRMDDLITTILVGNNLFNVAISAIGTALFISYFGNTPLTIALSTAVVTLFILVGAEITPKIFAVKHAEKISLHTAWLMDKVMRLMSPVVKIFLGVSQSFLRIFGEFPLGRSGPLVTEEEIRLMIELGREEGVLSDAERRMLQRIFIFGDTLVSQVMVPVMKIVAVNIDTPREVLISRVIEGGHSRIPVYEGNLSNMRGIVHVRDLLGEAAGKPPKGIEELLHPAHFVNYKKRVTELLRDFQRLRVYMAIVVDDMNKTVGLVTLEDLIEEIVGEIEGDLS